MSLGQRESKIVLTGEDRTRSMFRSADQRLAQFTKTITLSATAAAAAAAGLAILTKRALDNADAIGKTADATGIGVEALQEYRHAAELSGVSTGQLDSAFEAFAKRQGEVQSGTGTLTEFLKKYDSALLDTVRSAGSTEEALDAIFQGMADAATAADRAALGAAAFGRTAGVEMANLVRNGADGLQDMRDEAERLGLVLSESMVRQAEDANDALERMSRVAGVNLDRVLISLGPLVEAVADAFAKAGPKIASATDSLVKFIGGVDLLSLQGLKDELADVNTQIEDMLALARAGQAADLEDTALSSLRQQRAELEKLIAEREKDAETRRRILADVGDAEAQARDREREQSLSMLESLREARLSAANDEVALIEYRLDKQLEAITFSKLAEEERLEARVLAVQTAEAQINDINERSKERQKTSEERHKDQLQKIWESGLAGRVQITSQLLGVVSSAMQSGSKRMFEIGKAAALAQTVVDTYAAAQAQFKAFSWNPPLAYAAAAAAIVAGVARANAIRNQQFNSGATSAPASSAPPSGAASPGASLPPAPINDNIGPTPEINVNFYGSGRYTREEVIDGLLPVFDDLYKDGYKITGT